ncbi:MAG TPA: hypothetical protein VGX78_02660 [Pirellulales bacterium]|jgi:hypothetical protein|nr:hypothetical protein [Pirellulales bacterium]
MKHGFDEGGMLVAMQGFDLFARGSGTWMVADVEAVMVCQVK